MINFKSKAFMYLSMVLLAQQSLVYAGQPGAASAVSSVATIVKVEEVGLAASTLTKGKELKSSCELNEQLLKAVKNNDIQDVRILVEKGASVNTCDSKGAKNPLLTIAVKNQNEEMVAFLLEKGAFINARNTYGETALMQAVASGNIIITCKLINVRGVNLNTQSGKKYGKYTALMVAAANNDLAIVKVLVLAGADVTIKDRDGEAALDKASSGIKYFLTTIEEINAVKRAPLMLGQLIQGKLVAARLQSVRSCDSKK